MIDIKNIYKNFENQKVLTGVNCKIEDGEKVVIIGASGSGKSTLLRCMNLLTEPTYGEVWMDGKLLTPVDPYLHEEVIESSKTFKKLCEKKTLNNEEFTKEEIIKEIKEKDLLNEKHEGKAYKQKIKEIYNANHIDIDLARQKMGMCFQQFNLFNNLTVLENLTLAPVELKIMTKEEATKKAIGLLEKIDLVDGEKKSEIDLEKFITNSPVFLIILAVAANSAAIAFSKRISASISFISESLIFIISLNALCIDIIGIPVPGSANAVCMAANLLFKSSNSCASI